MRVRSRSRSRTLSSLSFSLAILQTRFALHSHLTCSQHQVRPRVPSKSKFGLPHFLSDFCNHALPATVICRSCCYRLCPSLSTCRCRPVFAHTLASSALTRIPLDSSIPRFLSASHHPTTRADLHHMRVIHAPVSHRGAHALTQPCKPFPAPSTPLSLQPPLQKRAAGRNDDARHSRLLRDSGACVRACPCVSVRVSVCVCVCVATLTHQQVLLEIESSIARCSPTTPPLPHICLTSTPPFTRSCPTATRPLSHSLPHPCPTLA